ncbi:predicted protein [Naegleria gruberi]|uniref:Aspartate dehydrogenase domain-containing protein n=1 Tax=Naegleria gruberi TaxID=5762 RepID=D2UZW1_NAEGR|nr:uncharacterized protein NAEGRDRAFT_62082 [Naegleria gruberi]EFC50232.1 predicted protein [Naegleria gruberi]|eukprot:XP_002682976.1 predicted protein [Naegleria gruberi strain NEG-M]
MSDNKTRVGIVGYGLLGQFLVDKILNDERASKKFEIAFVWNRTFDKVLEDKQLKSEWHLDNLDNFKEKNPNIIVEVAHPNIIVEYGSKFLSCCDLFVGSPTAFADINVEEEIRSIAKTSTNGCYIASGALWGSLDIQKMGMLGSLKGLTVTMKKHPASMKLTTSEMQEKLQISLNDPTKEYVIYEGPVRPLCPIAPNNVNTMAVASLAAENLGFDLVKARLVADSRLESHIIDIEVEGPNGFSVMTSRINPAKVGAVTGQATYNSFLSSLLTAGGRGNGFHFC